MFSGLTGWHLLIAGFIPFVLWIIALIQIAVSKASASTIALWIVIITVFPFLGAILWFAIGKRSAAREDPARATSGSQIPAAPAPVPVGAPSPVGPPAGWYPSPNDTALTQWWDGTRWTEHRRAPEDH